MIKKMILLSALLLIGFVSKAQNTTRYGLKLGPTVGFQKWNYFQNDPLFKYHAAAWLESYRDEDPFSVLLQLGYHLKGSATRYSRAACTAGLPQLEPGLPHPLAAAYRRSRTGFNSRWNLTAVCV